MAITLSPEVAQLIEQELASGLCTQPTICSSKPSCCSATGASDWPTCGRRLSPPWIGAKAAHWTWLESRQPLARALRCLLGLRNAPHRFRRTGGGRSGGNLSLHRERQSASGRSHAGPDRAAFAVASSISSIRGGRPDIAPDLRYYPVGNYLIFYRPTETEIQVARVLHGARDIQAIFRRSK